MPRVQAHRHDRFWVVVCSSKCTLPCACRVQWEAHDGDTGLPTWRLSVEAFQLPTPTSSCCPHTILQCFPGSTRASRMCACS